MELKQELIKEIQKLSKEEKIILWNECMMIKINDNHYVSETGIDMIAKELLKRKSTENHFETSFQRINELLSGKVKEWILACTGDKNYIIQFIGSYNDAIKRLDERMTKDSRHILFAEDVNDCEITHVGTAGELSYISATLATKRYEYHYLIMSTDKIEKSLK